MNHKRALITVLLVTLQVTAHAQAVPLPPECRPPVDTSSAQYIIGYGSLMEEKSKNEDAKNVGANFPIYITGFERGWVEHGTDPRFGTTYLGVELPPLNRAI